MKGLSLDLAIQNAAQRATAYDTLVVPVRSLASLGRRYRFDLFDKPATFRAQLASATDVYGFNTIGGGYYYNPSRQFQMSLPVDIRALAFS